MSATPHPPVDQFLDYLTHPSSDETAGLRLHLAQCADCRAMVQTLTRLKCHLGGLNSEEYRQAMQSDPQLNEMLERQLIEQFVDGRLDDALKKDVQTKIGQDKMALKAALFYAGSSAAMPGKDESHKPSSVMQNNTIAGHPGNSLFNKLWAACKTLARQRIAVWRPIAATVVAAGLLMFALTTFFHDPREKMTIASYRDNPVIHMHSASTTPGMGFFSTLPQTTMPFDNVMVALEADHHIVISWPAIPDAKAYTIRLVAFAQGKHTRLGEIITATTTATFEILEMGLGQRYEWRLTGETDSAQSFYADGGFVINRGDK